VKWDNGTGGQEQYVYDASGSRVLRRSTVAGSTTMTVSAFGLEEHLYSGAGVNQGNTYSYSLAGRLVGESTGSSTNLFLTDALGSVITTISATAGSAAVQGNQAYGPYGNSRYQAGNMGTAKGFTGQYQDATGLDYYNARYYDPVVGRFLSADTVESNLLGMDPYASVQDNPETHNDPTGHFGVPPCQNAATSGCQQWFEQQKTNPFVQGTLKTLLLLIDFFLGISAIIHDIQVLQDAKASLLEKINAAIDLAINVITDASLLIGEGEEVRGGEALIKAGEEGERIGAEMLSDLAEGLHVDCSFTFVTLVTTDHGKV
jgi:RHS repeat-associated protein